MGSRISLHWAAMRGRQPSALPLLLVAAAASICCFGQEVQQLGDIADPSLAVSQSDADKDMQQVQEAIALKTAKVAHAQKMRAEARAALRKESRPIPDALQKGTLVKLLRKEDTAAVIAEVKKA